MDVIAASVHVSKKTIYELLGNKQNLLYECVCYWIERHSAQIEQAELHSDSALATIIIINNLSLQQSLSCSPSFYNDIKSSSELAQLFEQKYLAAINACYAKQFNTCINQGLLQVDINISNTLQFFKQQIRIMYEETSADAIRKIDNYTFNILTHLSGICTDKGREELARISPKQFFR